jgi:phosphatidylserine/phosphatidylglycerophosphate/cardiolipin synthase-like enzyme
MTNAARIVLVLVLAAFGAPATRAVADERLCDSSFENCRTPLLDLIRNEMVGIDVAFWFMEDARYSAALIERWTAGVPVRVIMDTEANTSYPNNIPILQQLKDAGIPMLEKTSRGIVHWKTMIFAGQNVVEFSGANFSPHAFVPTQPYVDYLDEVIYFSDDPAIVNSFKTKYDDVWITTTGYTPYANITTTRTRQYPVFPINSELNFPPFQNFATRSAARYDAETQAIDSIMFRITDRRHTDAIIRAMARGVPFRLITDRDEYRDPGRLWNAYNIDMLYMAGQLYFPGRETVRMEAHLGSLHQKSTLLRSQLMTIFGSSNWTSPSASAQLEHNIFTKKPHVYQFFSDQFERKWSNTTGNIETEPFIPLPPDVPIYQTPENGAQNQATTVTLKWFGGSWAHKYDIYLGTDPANLTLIAVDQTLGPSEKPTQFQMFTVGGLELSTTYYWKVVAKTIANVTRSGAIWSFRTTGTPPQAGPMDAVLYAWKAPVRIGNWNVVSDSSAAGRARISNPNLGAARVGPFEAPTDYFEMKFNADAGVPYRLWIRGKAASNSFNNDSTWVQFSDSLTSAGVPIYRIGTTSAASVTIEDCTSCGLSNWGWNDNASGAGALGPEIFFETSGEHTIRIQVREDGLSIDQIVLSRDVFLTSAPGLTKDDGTILVESPGGANGNPPPPPTGPTDVVLHTTSSLLVGAWMFVDDVTAAGGKAAVLADAGRAKVSTAKATPADYMELNFEATGGIPYRIWIRGRAAGNLASNDSVNIQFSDSVDASGNPIYRIGTTSFTFVNLEDCTGCGNSGWGWEDNGTGTPTTLGPEIRFATDGVKTIRIQNREDGLYIDQIVLSPSNYLFTAPGANKDDNTILPPAGGAAPPEPPPPPPPPPPAVDIVLHMTAPTLAGAWQLVSDSTAASGVAVVLPDAARAKVTTPLANPADYVELTFDAFANVGYRLWIRGRAEADLSTNDSVHVQFTDSLDPSGVSKGRIGTTTSFEVNLEDCSACGNSGWGWEDNGWGTPTTLGPEIRFATNGTKKIRIQNREDGFYIDQIVLSPNTYLTAAPGANKDDNTILTPQP